MYICEHDEEERDKMTENIATRRGKRDLAIERPFPLDCWDVCRERNRVIFVRMRAQIQIGELGVENDSAKVSSIDDRNVRAIRGLTMLSIPDPKNCSRPVCVYRVRQSSANNSTNSIVNAGLKKHSG